MSVDAAFDTFQKSVNADPEQVRVARGRRDVFKRALVTEPDVVKVFGSGSLARSTQLKPVHDVDLVVVYDAVEHVDWGSAGSSSADALEHAQGQVGRLLGGDGVYAQLVRLTRVADRNRSVKCFIDPPEAADAFTVDVMPVLRHAEGHLWVPGARDGCWVEADPEFLTAEVRRKQSEWSFYWQMVRALKYWRLGVATDVKSLVMEVLAWSCLPTNLDRPRALLEFFTSAVVAVYEGVEDPAGLCGLIQPDLDVRVLADALSTARDQARLACVADGNGDSDTAKNCWRQVFGDEFPASGSTGGGGGVVPVPTPGAGGRPVKDAPQG